MNLAAEILKRNFSVRVKAKGYSMLPSIRTSDYVVIKPIIAKDAKIGDILAYLSNGRDKIICHRLIKREVPFLIIKGDGQLRCLERIGPDSLLGKVISIESGKNKFMLESNLYKAFAPKIAWISFRLPLLLFIFGYFVEALRTPGFVSKKIFLKIISFVSIARYD